MADKVRQDDVDAAAWAASDTFRGVIDPAQYKDYILTTLFLKYISVEVLAASGRGCFHTPHMRKSA